MQSQWTQADRDWWRLAQGGWVRRWQTENAILWCGWRTGRPVLFWFQELEHAARAVEMQDVAG